MLLCSRQPWYPSVYSLGDISIHRDNNYLLDQHQRLFALDSLKLFDLWDFEQRNFEIVENKRRNMALVLLKELKCHITESFSN